MFSIVLNSAAQRRTSNEYVKQTHFMDFPAHRLDKLGFIIWKMAKLENKRQEIQK